MSIKISQETTVGGWTGFLALTAEDKKLFNQTLIGFIGVFINLFMRLHKQ